MSDAIAGKFSGNVNEKARTAAQRSLTGILACRACILRRDIVVFLAMRIEIEREDDGRWIAEVSELPGVMAYGTSRDEAIAKAQALALRVIADRLEHGEAIPELQGIFAVPA